MKKILSLVLLLGVFSVARADNAAAAKAIAEAGKANSESHRIDLLAPAELEKMRAETSKLLAEAERTIAEKHLTDAKRQQVYAEIEALKQKMRIKEYEFQRIVSADYQMNEEINWILSQANLVRPLIFGHASWKTWIGLEALMERIGDVDIMTQVFFEIKIEEIPASQFISNDGSFTEKFPSGNLGELYTFVQRNNYSFVKFSGAHKSIMKIVSMASKAAEFKIRELRDFNQAIRLTIARLDVG